jgi:hypothetical protein
MLNGEARCFLSLSEVAKIQFLLSGRGLSKRIGAQLAFWQSPASLCFMPAHNAGGRLLLPAAMPAEEGCDQQTVYCAHLPLAA